MAFGFSSPALAPKNDSADDVSYREVPYNIEAEQMVLGAILTDNEALSRIGDFLTPEHFYIPVHKRILEAILRFNDRGLIATPVTLKNQFDQDEDLAEIGGATYLARLASLCSGILDVRHFASLVYSLAMSRELIHIGSDMVNDAYTSTGEERASEQIERVEQKLFTLSSEGNSDSSFAPLKIALQESLRAAEEAAKRPNAISGIPTGYTDMDNLFGGMHNSDLIILAARPAMGKTAFALNLALHAAKALSNEFDADEKKGKDQKPAAVAVVSLEMSSEQLATRMLSIKTGINASNIRRGKLEQSPRNNEFEKLVGATADLHKLPIFLDDTPALSIAALRTRARRLKRKHNLGFLIVDYLQLLRGTSAQAQTNRVQEISEISMGLKAIAKELNIPVLALSQLSRQVESREDKRPMLSDLRESGSIEQDADQVMFIFREAYYIERGQPEPGTEQYQQWQEKMARVDNIAEIIMGKNRHGPVAAVRLFFDKSTTAFGNLDQYHGDSNEPNDL